MTYQIFAILSLMMFSSAASWASDSPLHSRYIHQREFEQKIGYDEALKRHVGSEIVILDWPRIRACSKPRNWKITEVKHTRVNIADWADEWSWYARKSNKEVIVLKIESFRNDELAALKSMSEFANKSNRTISPYERGPTDLGTISVVLDSGYSYAVYWAFRDLAFSVGGNNKAQVLVVAHCMQAVAATNTVRRPGASIKQVP